MDTEHYEGGYHCRLQQVSGRDWIHALYEWTALLTLDQL